MSETLGYLRDRLARLQRQFRHLPRTLAIVREASGFLTSLWIALLVLQGVLPVAIVYLTRSVVNSLVAAIRSDGEWSSVRVTIVYACAIGLVMLALHILRCAANWVRTAQSQLVQDHIAGLVQKKSLEVDLGFYDSPDFYDHLHRARIEATYRPIELLESLGSLLQNGITAVAILAVLVPFGPVMPIALLLSTTPALFVVLRIAHRRHRFHQSTTEAERRGWYYDALLTEGNNAAEMRLFGLGEHFSKAFQFVRQGIRRERLTLSTQESMSELWAGSLGLLVLAATMAWMTFRAIRGSVSLGELALFYQAFNQGSGLSRTLLENLGKLYENSLFLGNLFQFLDLRPQIVSTSQVRSVPSPILSGIVFENVSFRYPGGDRLVLSDFNLAIRPGQTIALVGPNGMGKSTILKLLCRFYDPETGLISIDGIPLQEFSVSALRRSLSVFFQEPVRYNDTVTNNVAYGDLELTADQRLKSLKSASAASGVDDIASRLPKGFDTQLGRSFVEGTELSVGEWQRLALARATMRRSQILILDEPTSAMDPWAELQWAEQLPAIASGRITILITHRFTTAMFADLIHVISNGHIVESGTHAELLARGGVYAKGWATQGAASAGR